MAYNVEQKPGESVESYYRRLAKVADQRLVRLERLAQEEGYKGSSKWAYNRAIKDIQKWSGESAKRFNTAPPADAGQLRAKINDIKSFIGAKTSTKSGITKVYKKRADTYNRKYGTDFSWEDLANYYDRKLNERFEKEADSDVINKAISVIRSQIKNEKKTIEDLQHLARVRKNGGFEFNYTKKNGEAGQYDMIVDNMVHKILRSKAFTQELYDYMLR